ncbi:T9SS C-terminal target domain-containing protein [Chryseobacterium shandongense]|uniref:T9SS C-terminal target domain-containing protein n=1 Tax=Chryseobacterium shandongense TaxID=1493872 RepID=A0AAD0YBY0_9FLAO|nr:T9SS type A sorting domain-containing protein [Chryseobacterium shandongense]AZA86917.1 T9SS C-terminal target domain-containing protein [Chryseobacterium shandongense]AZA95333.1 T9SS C-terminal target domain-containing protein [Chryseobacterium shandongense]
MKIFSLLLIITTFSFFKSQTFDWQKSFGGTNYDQHVNHIQTPDGNYVFTGYTLSNNGDIAVNYGLNDAFLAKIDANGNYLWKKVYGGNNDDVPLNIINSNDNGVVLVSKSKSNSNTFSSNKGNNDLWVTKLDADGNITWNVPIAGSGNEEKAMVISTLNGYIISLVTNSSDFDFAHAGAVSKDVWIIKLDESGNILWKKRLQGSLDDDISKLKKIDNNEFLVLVNSLSGDGDFSANAAPNINKGFLLRFDTNGNLQLNAKIESADIQKPNLAYDVYLLNNEYVIGGKEMSVITYNNYDYNIFKALFYKMSATGNMIWRTNYITPTYPGNNEVAFIEKASDDNLVFFGMELNNNMVGNTWMIKMSNSGTIIKNTPLAYARTMHDLKKTSTDRFVLAVSYRNINIPALVGSYYFSFLFISPEGTTVDVFETIKSQQLIASNFSFSITGNDKVVSFLTESIPPVDSGNKANIFISSLPVPPVPIPPVLSVNEANEAGNKIYVYPNPATDFIKISEKMDILVLYDVTGKEIIKVKNSNIVDLKNISAGTYILRAKNKKADQSFKIIKK